MTRWAWPLRTKGSSLGCALCRVRHVRLTRWGWHSNPAGPAHYLTHQYPVDVFEHLAVLPLVRWARGSRQENLYRRGDPAE